ncbi:MAG: hypothetical protein ABI233_10065 [Chthoniobacterales bacterium]
MPSAAASYSLDESTVATLNQLAQQWQVSQQEALQRAVQQAVELGKTPTPEERIAALHALQKSLAERNVDFDEWQRTIRDGRR